MKKFSVILLLLMAVSTTNMQAQGFLKKVGSAVSKVEKTVGKASDNVAVAATDVLTKAEFINSIPKYKPVQIQNGENEDGTPNYSVFFVDEKTGQIRNTNAVAQQYITLAISGVSLVAKLKNAKGLGKVTALADAAVVVKEVTSLISQAKMINAYKKTFTAEGAKRDATMDVSNVDGFDFSALEVMEKSQEDIQKELAAAEAEGVEDFDIMAALSEIKL